MALKTRCGNR